MKKLYILLALFASASITQTINAQAPAIEWQRSLGGSDGEKLFCSEETADGGYIMGGYASSYDGDITELQGQTDCWVIKTDNTGDIQWQKTYGGTDHDKMFDILLTEGGGYIFAAHSYSDDGDVTSNNGDADLWIVKLDEDGAIEWQQSYGGYGFESPSAIRATSDGGYIISCDAWSNDFDLTENNGYADVWIIKIDSTGNMEWQVSYGGSDYEGALCIETTTDNGYLVTGFAASTDGDVTGNHGSNDAWVLKLNSTGDVEWDKCYGGSLWDYFSSGKQTSDGGYAFFGYSDSEDGDIGTEGGFGDCWLVKTNSMGAIEWEKTLGGSGYEEGFDMQLTPDDGYIAVGYTASNDMDVSGMQGNVDYWVVKLNSTGTIEWQKCVGGTEQDEAHSVNLTTDGGYLITGFTNSEDGDVTGIHGYYDGWVVKLTNFIGVENNTTNSFSLYPNPATDNITISNIERGSSISLHDVTGKLIQQSTINDVQAAISTAHLTSGVYFVQVKNENRIATQKLVVE